MKAKKFDPEMSMLKQAGADFNSITKSGEACLFMANDVEYEWLVANGAREDVAMPDGWNRLMTACLEGDSDMVKVLLDRGIDVNCRDGYDMTPLMICLVRSKNESVLNSRSISRYKVVQQLLMHGADVTRVNKAGMSALHLSCFFEEDAQLLQILIEKGANVDAKDKLGRTPLHLALKNVLATHAKILFDFGADVNCQDVSKRTPVMHFVSMAPTTPRGKQCACHHASSRYRGVRCCYYWDDLNKPSNVISSERCHVAEMMLSWPIDVSLRDSKKRTLLHLLEFADEIVCRFELNNPFFSLIQSWVEKGLDVNAQDTAGRTCLHVLTSLYEPQAQAFSFSGNHSQFGISDWVLSQTWFTSRCDASIADKEGEQPLHIACTRRECEAMVYPLLDDKKWKKKADVNACRVRDGMTPLLIFLEKHSQDIYNQFGMTPISDITVNYLLDRGVDPNMANCDGDAAVHIAARHGPVFHEWMDINLKNTKTGQTPLMLHCESYQQFFSLVESSANPASHSRPDIRLDQMAYLLSHPNLDLSAQDNEGLTAQDYGLDLCRLHQATYLDVNKTSAPNNLFAFAQPPKSMF
eukprot:TRINITY_DN893_c0_g6_i1.p1 TRINITY_DN893_c0_g6~~TRINITY_DN893_c0_g6_i1.p1  ORF type:complete len:581 (-),score=116.98 TRINITY_DN893_c0_g6_i1:38-1780(-)